MKILFSNFPWFTIEDGVLRKGVRAGSRWPNTTPSRSREDQFVDGMYAPYPFFMGYATSYAQKHCPSDTIIMRDSIARHESYRVYYEYIAAEKFDMIFVESATPCWEHDAAVIVQIKKHSPSSQIVVCGPIATAMGKSILADGIAVAAIEGEYEKGSVRAICGERGHIRHDMLTKEEMNAAPFPVFNAAEAHRYFDACPYSPTMPHAQVWSSRGCPFKCSFCSWPAIMTNNDPSGDSKRTVRHYSSEYMYEFISKIVRDHGFRSIYFDDDTFNLGKGHVERMCEVMRRVGQREGYGGRNFGPPMPWAAMCRADTIPLETWTVMRDSGCYGVKLGFESGNQHLVDTVINKGLDLAEARRTVIHLRRLGMAVHGTFTYGHPGETKEQMLETKAFIQSMPLNSWQESGTALLGATPLSAQDDAGKVGADFKREGDGNLKFNQIREELAKL